ncbi:hypothetical protein [Haloprofundus salilacus]|uniref:hypothetical protein n=1 Tax=Haloprofundus salilacus TaxID=2876190 RepID=UPI001CCC560A|nr:hypothetical protein [Haloprofundus salilacus]
MRRRALLAAIVAGLTTTAGCGDRFPESDDETTTPSLETEAATTADVSESTREESAEEPRSDQRIAVRNLRREATYVTLVVERAADGVTAFAESRTFPSGQERRFPEIPLAEGRYRVLVETDAGDRTEFEWTVVAELEGLAVDVDESETVFRRFARCRPDCPLSLGGTATEDLPLTGSGVSLWYQPAVVTLDNPTVEERRVSLAVSLSGQTLLDYRYRVPARSRLTVPTTYRSGTYTVVVGDETGENRDENDGQRTETEWHVPQEFEKRVVLGPSRRVTCGDANPVLWLDNRGDVRQTVRIRVEGDDGDGGDGSSVSDRNDDRVTLFDERRTVAPDERRELRPVAEAGQYELTVESETGASASTTWWACPPHSPITVLVDDGGFFLDQGIPR